MLLAILFLSKTNYVKCVSILLHVVGLKMLERSISTAEQSEGRKIEKKFSAISQDHKTRNV